MKHTLATSRKEEILTEHLFEEEPRVARKTRRSGVTIDIDPTAAVEASVSIKPEFNASRAAPTPPEGKANRTAPGSQDPASNAAGSASVTRLRRGELFFLSITPTHLVWVCIMLGSLAFAVTSAVGAKQAWRALQLQRAELAAAQAHSPSR